MRKILTGTIFLFGVFLIACSKKEQPLPIPVIDPNDGIEFCQAAEDHLKSLSCIPSNKPYTAAGKSFTQFCKDTMNNGIHLHPKCLSEITDCRQMNSCVQQ